MVIWSPSDHREVDMHPNVSQSYPLKLFVQNLCCLTVNSICGSNNPREATEATRIFYILCACSIWSKAVVLRAVGKEQCRVVWWQHCSTVVPPRIIHVRPQVKDLTTLIYNLDIFNFFLRTWLWLHHRLK